MHIRLVWWSCCFCAFGGRSCSSVLSHLVLVARTLSRLAKLKLDLSAFYCFVVSHVVLVPVLLLHSLSLNCSEQSAHLKGLQGMRSQLQLRPERSQCGTVHPHLQKLCHCCFCDLSCSHFCGFYEQKGKGYMVLKNRFNKCVKSILINT